MLHAKKKKKENWKFIDGSTNPKVVFKLQIEEISNMI